MSAKIFSRIGMPMGLLIALSICSSAAFAQGEGSPGPVDADRVVLRFHGGNFEVVSITPVVKVLKPSVALPEGKGLVSGTWFELRTGQDELRYRTMIGDPFRMVFEGPAAGSPLPAAPERKEAARNDGIFSLVIPRVQTGDQLVVFSIPTDREPVGQPAQEIVRIPLTPNS